MDNPICEKYQDLGKAVLWTINCRQLRLWERIRFRHRGTFKQVSTDSFHHVDDPDDGDGDDGVDGEPGDQVHEPGPKAGGAKLSSKVAATFLQSWVQIWAGAENKGREHLAKNENNIIIRTWRINWEYAEYLDF